jgi:hypothetical protein
VTRSRNSWRMVRLLAGLLLGVHWATASMSATPLAIHRPSEGLEFLHNGKSTGTIRDVLLARRFLDIWLSTSTSAPQMRQDLLTLKPL